MRIHLLSPVNETVNKPVFKWYCDEPFKEANFVINVFNDISPSFLIEKKEGPYAPNTVFQFQPDMPFNEGNYSWYIVGEFLDLGITSQSDTAYFSVKHTIKKNNLFLLFVILFILIFLFLFRDKRK